MRACVLSGLPNKSLRGIKGTSLIDISLSFLNVFLHCTEYPIKRKALQIELQGFWVYQTRKLLIFRNALASMFQRRMCRRETSHRHTKRRAGNIVVSNEMAPLDGVWIATVFAADTYF